jgi:N-acetylneuraminate synthase/N,N'-diacetyllegionaminate synthase
MNHARSVVIDKVSIQPGRSYIVAEIGINHNGDMELAKKQISAAAECGVDAVKFQNYATEDFILDKTLMLKYQNAGKEIEESQYDLFKRCELSAANLKTLKDYCDSLGISMHSTPTSAAGVKILKDLGVGVLKNGSDFLLNLELIKSMAQTGLPTVLSTGMANLAEIDDAVQAFYEAGGEDLILLVCTSSYPTPPSDVNLKRIQTLANTYHCLVGFSDHSYGITAALGAVALGSCWIEKHFTLDQNLPGPDHRFSSDPAEMKALVKAVRELETCLGSPLIKPTQSEDYGRKSYRLSCVASRDMSPGTVISKEDVTFRRPGGGYSPKTAGLLYGLTLEKTVKAGDIFVPSMFHGKDAESGKLS